MNEETRQVAEEEMLPDVTEDVKPVKEEAEHNVLEDVKPEPKSPEPTEEAVPAKEQEQPKGSKTPPDLLLKSLREEKKKRRELEKRLETLEGAVTPVEDYNEPESVESLQQDIRELKLDKFGEQYPELQDRREELDDYLEENSALPLDKAVNLFRLENGLIEPKPERKGLEKTNAGPKEAPKAKWSEADIEELRLNNPRKWEKLIDEGTFDDIGW